MSCQSVHAQQDIATSMCTQVSMLSVEIYIIILGPNPAPGSWLELNEGLGLG